MVPTSHKNVAQSVGSKDVQTTSCQILLSCVLKYSRINELGRAGGREKNVNRQCIRQMSAYLDLLNYNFMNIIRFNLRTLHNIFLPTKTRVSFKSVNTQSTALFPTPTI